MALRAAPVRRALAPFRRKYDIFPDGERFLVIRRAAESDPDTVAVALHWTAMLRRRS